MAGEMSCLFVLPLNDGRLLMLSLQLCSLVDVARGDEEDEGEARTLDSPCKSVFQAILFSATS